MAEDKKQYIVEYAVLADISQAAASLMSLTSMMQTFNTSYGAGIRQSSVAADRILKSAKTIGQNLGKQIDMTKPIAQMQAFQGALLNTFTNAHKAINGMFAGDMNTMSKAIAGLQNHGFRSEKAIGRMTGQMKSARSEATELAKAMQRSQQTMDGYSNLYKRFVNGIVGKGDKAKLSKSVLNTFTEDERKLIGKLTNDKKWMDSSGQRLNTGAATFNSNLQKAIHTYGESKKAYEEFIKGGKAAVAQGETPMAATPVMMSAKEMQDKVKATRNMIKSMNKLIADNKGKPKTISYTAVLNTEDALARLTALEARFRELQNLANISVRVKGGTAAKTFKDQITGINQSVTDLKNTLNSIVSGTAVKKGVGKKNAIPAKLQFDKEAIRKQVASISGAKIPVTVTPTFGTAKQKETLMNKIKKGIPAINLKLNTGNATASLNRFIKAIDRVRNQTINLNATATATYVTPKQPGGKTTGGTTTQPKSTAVGTTTTQGTAGRRPPQGTRTYAQRRGFSTYPLVGNTSFGVQTPAFVSMAKGMVGMMGIGAAFGLIGDAMHQAVEYQNTMMSVKAILESNKRYTGYTPENFREMERNIRRVGMDTKFTAPEVAGAARFMAMAGLSVDQINNSIRPIADVALIGDNDLETTADKITNIQTAFKLGKDPKSMRKLADNLTTTFTRFNTDMMMTAEAMQYAAPVASAAGLGIEDTLAMIGVMGNAGIQSSMAGTTLRMAMQNIIKPNKRQKELWDKLGISRHNADGSPRNIVDVLTELRAKTSDAQLMEVVSNLFRTTSMAGTVQIVRNLDLLKSAREDMILGRDEGLSARLSGEKQNTIKGLWAQVTSAFTEDNVLMFEKFQGKLKEMLVNIRDYLKTPAATKNLENIMELIKTMGSAFGTVVKVWMDLYNTFPGAVKAMMVIQFALSQISFLLNPIVGLYRVLRMAGMATGVVGATGAIGAAGAAGVAGAAGNALRLGAIPMANAYAGRLAGSAALGSAISGGLAMNAPLMMRAAGNSMAFQNAVMGGLALSTPMIQKQSWMARLGASAFGQSFTAARTAGALSLSGVASAGLSGLGTLLGTLLSPISLSLIGIAGTVTAIAISSKRREDAIARYREKAKANANHLKNTTDYMSRNISGGLIDEARRNGAVMNIGAISETRNEMASKWRVNPMFRHTKGYSSLFDNDATKDARRYIDDIYEQWILPSSTFNGKALSREDYYRQLGIYDPDNMSDAAANSMMARARNMGVQRAIQKIGLDSDLFKTARQHVYGLYSRAAGIKDKDERIKAFQKARQDALNYAEAFKPLDTYEHISDYGADTIGNLKYSRILGSYEARASIYSGILDMVNNEDNPFMKRYNAIMQLDTIAENEVEKRMYYLAQAIGAVEFKGVDMDNNMVSLDLQIKNGELDYQEFIAKIRAFNLKVHDTIGYFMRLSINAARQAQLEGTLPEGMSLEQFEMQLSGLSGGKRLTPEMTKFMREHGEAYAREKGLDLKKFSITSGSGVYDYNDVRKVYDWWKQKNGLVETAKPKSPLATKGLKNPESKTNPETGGTKGTTGAYTPDQSGYANHYQRSAARPTQINLNIQNLVNIDKTEFKSMDERELLSKLEFVVAQASTQLASTAAAQISALGSTTGDTQDVG